MKHIKKQLKEFKELIIFASEGNRLTCIFLTVIALAGVVLSSYYGIKVLRFCLILLKLNVFESSDLKMWSTIIAVGVLFIIVKSFIRLQLRKLHNIQRKEGLHMKEYITIKGYTLIFFFAKLISDKLADMMAEKISKNLKVIERKARRRRIHSL